MNTTPTSKQILYSQLSGWVWLGDGLFGKDSKIGWFLEEGGFYYE